MFKEFHAVDRQRWYRQIDGAQMYENEDQCGEAIRESGVPREEIFTSKKISDISLEEKNGF
jgi:diketogulonate reductase-like aldo/keto reductase